MPFASMVLKTSMVAMIGFDDEHSNEAEENPLSGKSLNSGGDAMDAGDGYETAKGLAAVGLPTLILFAEWPNGSDDSVHGLSDSSLRRFRWDSIPLFVTCSFTHKETRSLRWPFSFRNCSFSSLSRLAIFCRTMFRSISPCSNCLMRACNSASCDCLRSRNARCAALNQHMLDACGMFTVELLD